MDLIYIFRIGIFTFLLFCLSCKKERNTRANCNSIKDFKFTYDSAELRVKWKCKDTCYLIEYINATLNEPDFILFDKRLQALGGLTCFFHNLADYNDSSIYERSDEDKTKFRRIFQYVYFNYVNSCLMFKDLNKLGIHINIHDKFQGKIIQYDSITIYDREKGGCIENEKDPYFRFDELCTVIEDFENN